MKLTLRQRLIILISDKPVLNRFYVKIATRRDEKLAAEEFDKVIGGGLGTLHRADGSVVAVPVRRKIEPVQNLERPWSL